VFYNGFHGDTSRTVLVGNVDEKGKDLVEKTKAVLDLAISKVSPNNILQDIGNCIQDFANMHNYNVDQNFCGHVY
jgi:methionyl aminopeptidase